jgi:hypothetical protein
MSQNPDNLRSLDVFLICSVLRLSARGSGLQSETTFFVQALEQRQAGRSRDPLHAALKHVEVEYRNLKKVPAPEDLGILLHFLHS